MSPLNQVTSISKIWQEVYEESERALRVIASLKLENVDIQIGAVEIKNADSDDRLVVNSDGSINVNVLNPSSSGGTEADEGANEAGDGLIALTGAEDTILSIAVANGTTYHLEAWDWGASKECQFNLKILDGASLVKIIRVKGTNGSQAQGQIIFPTPVEVTGGASISIVCTAERLSGVGGFATAGINGFLI